MIQHRIFCSQTFKTIQEVCKQCRNSILIEIKYRNVTTKKLLNFVFMVILFLRKVILLITLQLNSV